MNNDQDKLLKIAEEAFRIESDCLKNGFPAINSTSFLQAVELLIGAQRIAASGCGHSGIACQHFVHLMCCIEKPARFIFPAEAIHGAMGFVQKNDVMVLASRGGKTQELLPILKICQKKGASIIAITENLSSPLAYESTVTLQMYINREVDKYNSQGTTSFIMLSSIFDAIQAVMIEKTGYCNEQFAIIHPGGAVGQRLNATSSVKNENSFPNK